MTKTDFVTYSASLVSQGKHRFYTLTMPSDTLALTSTVDTRLDNPVDGFQRKLDSKRADEIARYIDEGLGTIPTAIVLSAQSDAELRYERSKRSIRFKVTPRSFLILDGQHRVFGFSRAKTTLRVPVVIYNGLSRAEECQLFIDINTKQRPVPNELLLDIKKLANSEKGSDAFVRQVFDLFDTDPESPLLGMMSPSSKATGKISRVTFNGALKPIWGTFEQSEPARAYAVLSAYLHACIYGLTAAGYADRITNPILFKGVLLLFPDVAQRVADRYGDDYSVKNFSEVLEPFFRRVRPSDLKNPGTSYVSLYETFAKVLRQNFTISRA